LVQPFQDKVEIVKKYLLECGHKVSVIKNQNLAYLLVDDYCTVGDNIDADLGMAYNCTGPLDFIPFDKVLEIGRHVRQVVTVGRVIVFGGSKTTLQDLLNAEETRNGLFIGIHAVKSKSYNNGYQCLHLGYGVNEKVQAPTILTKAGIPVSLFGKVADVVINEGGKSVSCVNTSDVLDLTIAEIKKMNHGFICTNVQETDLAGHSQNSNWYKELLELSDEKIGQIVKLLNPQDLLVIMADHGNDPNIGHNRHTRENVPLLIKTGNCQGVTIGLRKSLSDVGASVCDFFSVEAPQNGESFLKLLKKD
jgi:phosphopentomutase